MVHYSIYWSPYKGYSTVYIGVYIYSIYWSLYTYMVQYSIDQSLYKGYSTVQNRLENIWFLYEAFNIINVTLTEEYGQYNVTFTGTELGEESRQGGKEEEEKEVGSRKGGKEKEAEVGSRKGKKEEKANSRKGRKGEEEEGSRNRRKKEDLKMNKEEGNESKDRIRI